MATIVENKNQKGTTYRIQVSIRDPGTGKRVTKSTTYEPPPGMSGTKLKEALDEAQKKFEKKVRVMEMNKVPIFPNSRLKDAMPYYLNSLDKKGKKKSHKSGTARHLEVIEKKLGNHQIMKINAVVCQNFIDYLRTMKKETSDITVKHLEDVMQEQGIGSYKLADLAGVSPSTIKKMKNQGQRTTMEVAEKIAMVLDADVDYLFNIDTTIEEYAPSTLYKYQVTLSGLLGYLKGLGVIEDNYAIEPHICGIYVPPVDIECMDEDQAIEFLDKLEDEEERSLSLIWLYS